MTRTKVLCHPSNQRKSANKQDMKLFNVSFLCSLPHGTDWNRRPSETAYVKPCLPHTRNRRFANFEVSFWHSLPHGTDWLALQNFSFRYGTDCSRSWNPLLSRLLFIILSKDGMPGTDPNWRPYDSRTLRGDGGFDPALALIV